MMIAMPKPIHLHARRTFAFAGAAVISLVVVQFTLGQMPGFPSAPSQPAINSESKVEAYTLNAATRDVLTAWQQSATGRTDIRVAIDERTGQALVFASPAIQSQIQQQLAAKTPATTLPAPTPVAHFPITNQCR